MGLDSMFLTINPAASLQVIFFISLMSRLELMEPKILPSPKKLSMLVGINVYWKSHWLN